MKYLSIDLEATGLRQQDLICEVAIVPFCSEEKSINNNLAKNWIIKTPSFEELLPSLDKWVIEHNEQMIRKCFEVGISLGQWKLEFEQYLESKVVKDYFKNEKIVLFGKSMNAIDLPFLNRDLGWDWIRKYFSHRQLDFSSVCYGYMDIGLLPPGSESGSTLMKYLGLGEVAHTALEDAINTALMYLKTIELSKK